MKAGEVFTTAVDQQREMLIHVLQGERERAKDNWSLGRFAFAFEPAPRGVPRVGVQFEIDANGILHVLARDLHTRRETVVEMRSAVDVDDQDVQKMVEESVEHFYEDVRARQWVETKLKAAETLAATGQGLAECAAELDPGYREKVERACAAVKEGLAAEDPKTQTGDPDRLKAAVAALDEATKPLADLLMDRAMDAMLRQRGLIQS
jgi:molecular chaperone DnaK